MTIDALLLNACSWAYAVTASAADAPELAPYALASTLVRPTRCFASGANLIDAALIGQCDAGVVLAFRGTMPPADPDHEQTLKDWMQDFEVGLVQGDKLPGRVHHGFVGALDALWDAVAPQLQASLAASPVKKLLVTGHSKGGAMAHLAAARCALSGVMHGSDISVRSFEGAHPGDQAFADQYLRLVPDVVRWESGDDLVPHLAPSTLMRSLFKDEIANDSFFEAIEAVDEDFDYAPAGPLKFADWNGAIQVGGSALLSAQRFTHLAARIAQGDFAGIVAEHSIDINSRLYKLICPPKP